MTVRLSRPKAPLISPVILSASLLLPAIAPMAAFAAGPDRKIEVSSEKTPDGQSSVTVVISGIPPEDLGSEGMKALLGYLTGKRDLPGLMPVAKDRAKANGPSVPATGADRDEKEFDLELKIHWKRSEQGQQEVSRSEPKKPGEPKVSGEPKRPGEAKTPQPAKEGTTLESLKKMISGGPAKDDAPAAGEKPEAKQGDTRRNAAEVEAILRDLGSLQRQIADQAKGVERVKGLGETAGKAKGGPESAAETRKVAEAVAELEKLTRDIEQRSKEVEQALDRARAKLKEAGPESAGGPSDKPAEEPKKKRKKPGKPGRPKTVNESQ
jgi:hypothetical protein